MNATSISTQDFKEKIEADVQENILPFWIRHTQDKENGGFYGALTNDLQIHNETPRSAILCARILWTYAAAYRRSGKPEHLAMAQRAYDYLTRVFWDQTCGGVYWQVDCHGKPVNNRKHSYAQSFAIYGLAEYFRATQEPKSLLCAQELFKQLENHAYDLKFGGYIEGCGRDWGSLEDMRLSEKEINCRKSMNTTLHILEAFTNLRRVWEDEILKARHKELIEIFLRYVIDPETHHLTLFFDDNWNSLKPNSLSYGHDIEASWLLVEAAETSGEANLLQQCRSVAVEMAQVVFEAGLDADGSLFYEGSPQGPENRDKHWWVQAEGVVGFYNAYQVSCQVHFAQASRRCWEYIENYFIDRKFGDWFKVLDQQGRPYPNQVKVGPWECPYHQSRAAFEMSARLTV